MTWNWSSQLTKRSSAAQRSPQLQSNQQATQQAHKTGLSIATERVAKIQSSSKLRNYFGFDAGKVRQLNVE